jgi:transposase
LRKNKHNQSDRLLGRSPTVVLRWANAYRRGGITRLLQRKKPPGKKASLGAQTVEEMTKGLKEGRWKRAKEVRAWLESDQGVRLTLKGTYYWLGKLGGVLKVPRKTHAKKDAEAAERFKAELSGKLEALDLP